MRSGCTDAVGDTMAAVTAAIECLRCQLGVFQGELHDWRERQVAQQRTQSSVSSTGMTPGLSSDLDNIQSMAGAALFAVAIWKTPCCEPRTCR